jgi:hypothetical protein
VVDTEFEIEVRFVVSASVVVTGSSGPYSIHLPHQLHFKHFSGGSVVVVVVVVEVVIAGIEEVVVGSGSSSPGDTNLQLKQSLQGGGTTHSGVVLYLVRTSFITNRIR